MPDFSNTQLLANFVENKVNILGNVDTNAVILNLTYTLRKYDAQKSCTIQQFYSIVSVHPCLSKLAEEVECPEQKDTVITKFVLLTRGVKTKSKNRIINTCLMLVAQKLRLKSSDENLDWSNFWIDSSLFTKAHAKACYQPNVTSLFHRQLFKYFHEEGILYSLVHDFNYKGSFQVYWIALWQLVKENRPDFSKQGLF